MDRYFLTRCARSLWVLLCCLLVFLGCSIGWKKYSVEEVVQVLYEEDLITSRTIDLVEYPGGTQVVNLSAEMLTLNGHYGSAAFYRTRRALTRATGEFAQTMKGRSRTYSEFIEGNVVITVFPELSEKDAERFRRALANLR